MCRVVGGMKSCPTHGALRVASEHQESQVRTWRYMEYLELQWSIKNQHGALGVHGACDKGTTHLRRKWVIRQRIRSSNKGYGAPKNGMEHLVMLHDEGVSHVFLYLAMISFDEPLLEDAHE